MLLRQLLRKLEDANKEIYSNNQELAQIEERKQIITDINTKLEKEKEKIVKEIKTKKLLAVNIFDVFNNMQEKLTHYEGRFCVGSVYRPRKVDEKNFNAVKQNILEENVNVNICFQFVHFSGRRFLDYNLEYPFKEIKLNNGKRLINVLEIANNEVIIPKDVCDKIILNIDFNDENMKSTLFYNAVMKCVEERVEKN